MNRRTAILLTVLLICMVPTAVYAEPTITGPTGLIVNPTADTAPTDHMWFALNFLDLDTFVLPDSSTAGGSVWTGLLTGGITDSFEAGIGFSLQEESSDAILFSGKFLLLAEDEEAWYPAVAAGGVHANFNGETNTNIYVVGSKFFWLEDSGVYSGSIHAGIDMVNSDVLDWELMLFGGADVAFSEDIIAIVEWHEDEDGFGQGFTYGVRFYFSDTTTGQAGFIDGDLTVGGAYIF